MGSEWVRKGRIGRLRAHPGHSEWERGYVWRGIPGVGAVWRERTFDGVRTNLRNWLNQSDPAIMRHLERAQKAVETHRAACKA